MSSWDSYLPKDKKYKKVVGHGLNRQELETNKIFDTFDTKFQFKPRDTSR